MRFQLVLLGLLGVVAYATAQHASYAFNHSCYPHFNYYTAPAHNYNYYQYPVQKVVAQEIAVAPLIVTVPVDSKAIPVYAYGANNYYSISDAYREKANIRQIIQEELRAALQGITQQPQQQQQQQPKRNPDTPIVSAPPPGANTPLLVADNVTPETLQLAVLTAFRGKGNCLNCHSANNPAAGFSLVTQDGQLAKLSSDKRWKVYGMASTGAMPPAAANDANKAMESAHLPKLLEWAAIK